MFNKLIKVGCNFIYFILKFKRTQDNKIVFISRLSNDKTLDFKLLEESLNKEGYNNIVFCCKRIDNFKEDLIGNIKYTIKCLNELATSKVCVTDSYTLAVSAVKHKKNLKVIQIWHSMGAIKKFGYQTIGKTSGRDYQTAKILNMHQNYDYIISGSNAMTKYFAKAFNYPEKTFLNYGLPRMDYLLQNEKKLKKIIFDKYPSLKKKKNILYAPTFRTTKDDKSLDLINNINFEKYNLIIKGHANQKIDVKNPSVLTCKDTTALDLLTVCDYLITDYSGIAIEAAILLKKTFYFVYDYKKYQQNNGLNIDLYKEMPGCVFDNAKELVKAIDSPYNLDVIENYKKKYIDVANGKSTEKICQLIIKNIKDK